MLFDLGWSELMLIGVIALVVVGPKDLPKALRVAGYWLRKAREMSREFQSSVDQMIREAELDEITKVGELDLEQEIRKSVDPDGSLAEALQPPELPGMPTPVAVEEPAIEPELPLAAPVAEEETAVEPELPLSFPDAAEGHAEGPNGGEAAASPPAAEDRAAPDRAPAAPEPGIVPPRP
jgi:sec-independent protein translocase protein TatB